MKGETHFEWELIPVLVFCAPNRETTNEGEQAPIADLDHLQLA